MFLDLGFPDAVTFLLRSYVTKRASSSYSLELSCGIPEGSILGPLIFLSYVNDVSQAVDCVMFYADDSCG